MSTRRAIRIVVLFSIASVSATGVTFFSTLELTKPLFQTPTAPLSPVSATETQSAQFPPQTRAAIAIPDFATIFSYFGVAEPQPSPLVAPVAISNKPAAPPRPSQVQYPWRLLPHSVPSRIRRPIQKRAVGKNFLLAAYICFQRISASILMSCSKNLRQAFTDLTSRSLHTWKSRLWPLFPDFGGSASA